MTHGPAYAVVCICPHSPCPLPPPLHAHRAPQKRRGVLWMYMQQQTCQEGENMDAFMVAVARLYDSQELPAHWTTLMDAGACLLLLCVSRACVVLVFACC
jgi:hypothetical protein